jgi:hypothetical protein
MKPGYDSMVWLCKRCGALLTVDQSPYLGSALTFQLDHFSDPCHLWCSMVWLPGA